jgi:hypothetical protein
MVQWSIESLQLFTILKSFLFLAITVHRRGLRVSALFLGELRDGTWKKFQFV